VSHIFNKDGYYTAYFAVKETNTDDAFITVLPVTVRVNDNSNTAPHDVTISYTPSSPDTGDTISFTGSAIDDQRRPLFYTWNFGDNIPAQEPRRRTSTLPLARTP